MCVCMWLCRCKCSAGGGQKRAPDPDPEELELEVAGRLLTWGLGIEHVCSGRAVNLYNHRAISPVCNMFILKLRKFSLII